MNERFFSLNADEGARMESSRRPFKIGVFVPHFELPWNGVAPRWAEIAAMAKRAEEVGFDSFWMPDHMVFRFEGVNQQGGWDVWSLMSAIAAETSRIEIAPLVACSSFRNPALIAKMADSIDEISGGRFILGLGAGWHKPEYDAFGFPYDHRVSRFEEALRIISSLLRTGQVDFEGRFYSARECELRPRGPRPAGPPILVGGGGDRVIRLAATYADAWNVDRKNDVTEVKALKEKVDAACVQVGRDPRTLSRIIGIQVDLLNDTRVAMYPRQFVQHPWPLVGTPEELAARIREYRDAAVEHMMVWVDPNNLAGIEAFAPVLAALDRGCDTNSGHA
ncbi:MAG: LLM class flavin-dependent oxidoreductase [Thermomicrobiales bacterium]|nr:LLM class flavin-dependent oxidoreductase [Thermomicrobiales bacterium]